MRLSNVRKKVSVCKRLATRYLRPKHYRYLNRWAKKLNVENNEFFLYVFPYSSKANVEAIVKLDLFRRGKHAIGISTAAFKKNSWKDAIVHELLHVMFHQGRMARRKPRPGTLSSRAEENMVYILAGLLARGPH